MAKPRALILTGYGINCDYETRFAFELAGAEAERVHVNDLIDGRSKLSDHQILAFPGGFSYGDDIASGKVLANRVKMNLGEMIAGFVESGGLILGVCNGFQVLVKYGLLGLDENKRNQTVTLTYNDSNRYEDRWVHLRTISNACVFTRGIDRLYLPVAHGEGKFFASETDLESLFAGGQVALGYADADGRPADGRYPENPNGSVFDIAGLSDPTGRIFGLMPHPERFLHFTCQPEWTRIREALKRDGGEIPTEGQGLMIFRNAVEYFS